MAGHISDTSLFDRPIEPMYAQVERKAKIRFLILVHEEFDCLANARFDVVMIRRALSP